MLSVKLYISSVSKESRLISTMLRQALAKTTRGDFEFEVISVLDQPARAQMDRIMATPTAVRTSPGPEVRVIGNFRQIDQVLKKLGISNGNELNG